MLHAALYEPHTSYAPRSTTELRDLDSAPFGEFKNVRFVLTDMDETLTHEGRLSPSAYAALEHLRAANKRVIVVTAAPAGWCDQMARMWPVDGVIGENGGFYFHRGSNELLREFWIGHNKRKRLLGLRKRITAIVPDAVLADDQPFRLTSLAFVRPREAEKRHALIAALKNEGLNVTENNLWLLGWIGDFDKLAMARRVLGDIDERTVCYLGDSENDAPMFAAFHHTIGMSTVREHTLSAYPRWVTRAPGGAGFVEAAEAVLAFSW